MVEKPPTPDTEPKTDDNMIPEIMKEDPDFKEIISSKGDEETSLETLTRFVEQKPDEARHYVQLFEEVRNRHPEWENMRWKEWEDLVGQGDEEVVQADMGIRMKRIIEQGKDNLTYEKITDDPDFKEVVQKAGTARDAAGPNIPDTEAERKAKVKKRAYDKTFKEGLEEFTLKHQARAKRYAERWDETNPTAVDAGVYKELARLVKKAEKPKKESEPKKDEDKAETLEEERRELLEADKKAGEAFRESAAAFGKVRGKAIALIEKINRLIQDREKIKQDSEAILAGITDPTEFEEAKKKQSNAEQDMAEAIWMAQEDAGTVEQNMEVAKEEASIKCKEWGSVKDKIVKNRKALIKVYQQEVKKNEMNMNAEGAAPGYIDELRGDNLHLKEQIDLLEAEMKAEEEAVKKAAEKKEEEKKALGIEQKKDDDDEKPPRTWKQLMSDVWADMEAWSGHKNWISRFTDYIVDKSLELSGMQLSKKQEKK